MRFVAMAAVAASLAVAASAPAATGAAHARCGPPGATQVAADGYGSLVKAGTRWYACRRRGVPLVLGVDRCFARPGAEAVGPPRLSGPFVALWTRRCGIDTAVAGVRTIDLRSGRRVVDVAATGGIRAPETIESVAALRIRRDGAVAWVADASSIATHVRRRQLWVVDSHRRRRLLDSGNGLAPPTLRLGARAAHWRNGARSRSASVD